MGVLALVSNSDRSPSACRGVACIAWRYQPPVDGQAAPVAASSRQKNTRNSSNPIRPNAASDSGRTSKKITFYAPTVTLYGLPRSVYTRIVRLTLDEKAVPCQIEEVDIFGPGGVPAAHTKRHPFGRIPVLAHGELSIYETAAICRYVDEAFPGPSLQPPTPSERARMAQVIGLLDSYCYRPMVWGVFVQRVRIPMTGGSTDESLVAKSLKESRIALEALAAVVADSPFFAGTTLSLADLHAYPILRYFSLAPEGQAAIDEHRALTKWLAKLGTRASVQRTVTQYEQHAFGSRAA